MKKIALILVIVTLFSLVLTSCESEFDMEKSIEDLKAIGFIEMGVDYNPTGETSKEGGELIESIKESAQINSHNGTQITVDVVPLTQVFKNAKSVRALYEDINNINNDSIVYFVTFYSEEEAIDFANSYPFGLSTARSGYVVVVTSLKKAMDVIGLDFK